MTDNRIHLLFEDWWEIRGDSLDPEPAVSWHDKRKDYAEMIFTAAMAISRNYVADKVEAPNMVKFANTREVWINEIDGFRFLEID